MNYLQKKKIAFMSIVNRVKGFIRTITGTLPLTLEGCVDEESIIDYTLYGQSVQNGTPTPDTPIEVESVGEKTRNLFNPKQTPVDLAPYLGMVLENKTYTLRIVLKEGKTVPSGVYFGLMYSGSAIWFIENGKVKITKSSLDLSAFNNVSVSVYSDGGNTKAWNSIIDAFDIYLSEGTTATNEPYGYKIPIKVSGKNLFDIDKAENGSMDDFFGGNIERDNRVRTNYIYVKAGTYCVSTISTSGGVRSSTICHTYSTPLETTHIGAVKATSGTILTGTKAYSIFTILVDCYVRFLFLPMPDSSITDLNTNTLNDFKPQIERGDMPTDYEPYHEPITTNIYLDEPLGEGQSINYKKDGLPPIPTFKGTSIISADTTIQPSNAEITYYSNVKE